MEADFSGYATRADIRCSDGRTITPDAFKHQDQIEVPLVWQHNHDNPKNILGHAILEHRDASHPEGAGIYCYGFFNDTEAGQTTEKRSFLFSFLTTRMFRTCSGKAGNMFSTVKSQRTF